MSEQIIICQICGKSCTSVKSLAAHLHRCSDGKHDISAEGYYKQYINSSATGKCQQCNSPVGFNNMLVGYNRLCQQCSRNDPERKKNAMLALEKTGGVGFANKNTRQKALETMEEKYGVTNSRQCPPKAKQITIFDPITISNMGKEQDEYLISLAKGNEKWTTEDKVKWILQDIFPNHDIVHNKRLHVSDDYYTQPDYVINDIKLVVDFHGYQHYTNPVNVFKDDIKREQLANHRWTWIELPYFVQLSDDIISHIFRYTSRTSQYSINNYEHGFIHPNSMSFGHFCKVGLERAKMHLKQFPDYVHEMINRSLIKRCQVENIPTMYLIS